MLDNTAWDHVADIVTAEDFYRRDHRLIFSAIAELADRGEPSDAVTVSELLERRGELEDAGGLHYLGQIARETPSAANIRSYAGIVRERSMLRELKLVIRAKSGPEGKLFGSVSTSDIADAAEAAGVAVERSEVRLAEGPLRTVGEHEVEIHLHTEVSVPITVVVEAEE